MLICPPGWSLKPPQADSCVWCSSFQDVQLVAVVKGQPCRGWGPVGRGCVLCGWHEENFPYLCGARAEKTELNCKFLPLSPLVFADLSDFLGFHSSSPELWDLWQNRISWGRRRRLSPCPAPLPLLPNFLSFPPTHLLPGAQSVFQMCPRKSTYP